MNEWTNQWMMEYNSDDDDDDNLRIICLCGDINRRRQTSSRCTRIWHIGWTRKVNREIWIVAELYWMLFLWCCANKNRLLCLGLWCTIGIIMKEHRRTELVMTGELCQRLFELLLLILRVWWWYLIRALLCVVHCTWIMLEVCGCGCWPLRYLRIDPLYRCPRSMCSLWVGACLSVCVIRFYEIAKCTNVKWMENEKANVSRWQTLFGGLPWHDTSRQQDQRTQIETRSSFGFALSLLKSEIIFVHKKVIVVIVGAGDVGIEWEIGTIRRTHDCAVYVTPKSFETWKTD